MMSDFFKGKIAIVTGASSGIGAATARLLAERGATVVLATRRKDELENLARELGDAKAIAVDVTKEADLDRLVHETFKAYGRIDILVNNAGVLLYKPIVDSRPEEVRGMMEVNFFGAAACAMAVLKVMRRQRSGWIVNVSSIAGRVAFPNLGYYSATKFAFTGFSEALRQELAPEGVKVMSVNPGTVRTEMTRKIMEDAEARGKRTLPITPERVARAIVNGIESGKMEVYVPFLTYVLYCLHFLFPKFAEWLAWHFRASAPAPPAPYP